jgi:hypothetical protein
MAKKITKSELQAQLDEANKTISEQREQIKYETSRSKDAINQYTEIRKKVKLLAGIDVSEIQGLDCYAVTINIQKQSYDKNIKLLCAEFVELLKRWGCEESEQRMFDGITKVAEQAKEYKYMDFFIKVGAIVFRNNEPHKATRTFLDILFEFVNTPKELKYKHMSSILMKIL